VSTFDPRIQVPQPTPPFVRAPGEVITGYSDGGYLPDMVPGPRNFSIGALANSVVVPGRIVVYGFTVYSTKASAQKILCFDANAVPTDTAVPLFAWALAANSGVGFGFSWPGRQFQTGLVLCNSSTDATKTIGGVDCFFDVQFDVYSGQNAPGTGQ
jgi:hypothetical protein